jgi:hypothetical protein
MRPFDVPLTDPPTWIDELRQAVLWPNKQWAAVETLSIFVACRELEGWLADGRDYQGAHKQGWVSAVEDYNRSVSQLGPHLRQSLGQVLTAATDKAVDLKRHVESTSASAVATYLEGHRVADGQQFGRLRTRWSEADTRAAAWADLIEACRDPATGDETLAVRRDLFWQLLRTGNYGGEQTSQLLGGVLTDSAFHVWEARIWVGDITEAEAGWPRPDQDAGLSQDQRLALCRRFLITPPRAAHHVVWLAFDHTGPAAFYHREVGPMSFWNCRWTREVLRDGGANLDSIPSELKDQQDDGFFGPNRLPDDSDVMLARVDLGTGAWTDPVRFAEEQAEAVVALAGFHVGDAKWRQVPGHLIAIDGRVRSVASFGHTFDPGDIANGLYQDRMDAELANLTPQLQAHLPIVSKDLSEVVQAIRWWQQARQQPPLAAVLLHVRVLELVSQRVGVKKWYEYLGTYHRAFWIRRSMVNRLGSVIDACFYSYERLPAQEDQTWLREFGLSIRTFRQGGRYELDLKRGIDELPKLAGLFPQHDRLGRRVRGAADQFNLTELRGWYVDLTNDWELVLERLIRVRNALAHGGPIEDDTVATVRAFVEHLAGWSLSVALDGLLGGSSVLDAHAARQHQAEQWTVAFGAATNVSDALLGP